jgi:acetyl-CoA synthetase
MTSEHQPLLSEAPIAVHWCEEKLLHTSAEFIGQANAADQGIFQRFRENNLPDCFREYADPLGRDTYWHTTLETSNAPLWKWFVGAGAMGVSIASTGTSHRGPTRPR